MPIGSYTHQLTRNPIKRAMRLTFGTVDLHSHLRLRPLLNYMENLSNVHTLRRIRVLELGDRKGVV